MILANKDTKPTINNLTLNNKYSANNSKVGWVSEAKLQEYTLS